MEQKLSAVSRIEKTLMGIASFILLWCFVLVPIDIISFYTAKESYAQIYSVSDGNWEWKYLKQWILIFVVTITGLTVIILRLKRGNNELIRKVNWIFLFLFLGSIVIGFYKWMNTGFDH